MKKYRFFYHWNKPVKKWSVHFKGKCFLFNNFLCYIAYTETKINKRQPKRVIQGFAKEVLSIEYPDGEVWGIIQ